jgi:hypothetical protein
LKMAWFTFVTESRMEEPPNTACSGGVGLSCHKRLDVAVFAAYGWKSDLSDEEILEKLLALNLEKSKN